MATETREGNPYVGPRPFERQDRVLFFGRDREISDVVSLIIAHRTLLLYAQSGAGKTSLINASLIPMLEEEGFEVLPAARVRGRIPEDIAPEEVPNPYVLNTLISWAETEADPKPLVEMPLAGFLRGRQHPTDELGLPSPRAVIFDQFEELFTFYPERWRDREEFFKQVADALEADPLLRVVLVIREEYIAQLDPYAPLLPEELRTRFRLERLRKEAALAAIKGPLGDTSRSFAEGVAEELVEDLMKVQVVTALGTAEEVTGEFVEPVQLQVVCQSLWQGLPPDVTIITRDHLQAFGDVNQALSGFYERSIERAAQEPGVKMGDLRAWFEDILITPAGTRGTVYKGREGTGGIPNAAVNVLENLHLIRGEWRAGARWYELTHDRFIEPIQESNKTWREKKSEEQAKKRGNFITASGIAVATLVVVLVFWMLSSLEIAQTTASVAQETAVAAAAVEKAATQEAQQAKATATQAALALWPVDALRSMLTKPTPSERAAAAKALGQTAAARPEIAAEVVPLLTTVLSDDSNATVRRAAAQALVEIAGADPDAMTNIVTGLIMALQDNDYEVRIAAAQALGWAGPSVQDPEVSRQAAEALRTLLNDKDVNVRQAAAEALTRVVEMSIGTLVGHWTNVDPDTQGITRIEIDRTGYSLSFHAFGKCHPTDCDWGVLTVPYTGVPVVVPYVFSFASETLTVTLEPTSNQLVVEAFTHFTDDSGRADYTASYVFGRGIPEPTPTSVPIATVTPGDKLFVALFWESDGMAVVDMGTSRVEKTISFDSINARYVSANPVRQEVYVSFANGDTFYVIDARSGAIKETIQEEVGWNAENSVVSLDRTTVYLASSGGPGGSEENKILVIDLESLQLEKVIRLGPYDFPGGLSRLEISPDGQELYTIDLTANELIVVDVPTGDIEFRIPTPGTRLLGISPDGGALYVLGEAEVSKVKIGTWTEVWRVAVQGYVERVAIGADIVYVPDYDASEVIRVEDGSGHVLTTWDVIHPTGVALSPDGTKVYVSSTKDNKIYIFDTGSSERVGQINIRRGSGPTDIVVMTVGE